MQTIHIDSLDELPHAAAAVINALEGRSVVVFRGEMGAGKTTLIREIVARLGADDTVTSPTFAIVNQYTTREGKNIYHFDFYRINRLEEAYDFGYEEYFYSGDLCLVEWPEKIEELLPEEVMTVRIAVGDDEERTIEIALTLPIPAQYPCIVLLNTDFPPSGSSRRDHPAHGCNRECVIQPGSNDRLPKRISGVVSFPTPQRETERSREPAGQIRLATLYHPCSK